MLVGAIFGYGRSAYAACASVGGSAFQCSGASSAQSIAAANADVTALTGFSVNTSFGNALTITGAGDISYTDLNFSPLTTTSASGSGLYLRSNAGFPGSLTIDLSGTITARGFGITARNAGTGGALTITADGDVTATGTTARGIFALNFGTDLAVSTGAGADVTGASYGIFARNYGTGATSVTTGGDVTALGTSGNSGILVRNSAGGRRK